MHNNEQEPQDEIIKSESTSSIFGTLIFRNLILTILSFVLSFTIVYVDIYFALLFKYIFKTLLFSLIVGFILLLMKKKNSSLNLILYITFTTIMLFFCLVKISPLLMDMPGYLSGDIYHASGKITYLGEKDVGFFDSNLKKIPSPASKNEYRIDEVSINGETYYLNMHILQRYYFYKKYGGINITT